MPTTIQLFTAPSLTACLALQDPAPDVAGDDIVILPSSLRRQDRAASEIRAWLRTGGATTHLLLPESPVASILNRRGRDWTPLGRIADNPAVSTSIELPSRLVTAPQVWTVSDIDLIGGRGPYVLDLPVRYANMATRMKVLGSRQRADLAVALLNARPLHRHLIVRHFPSFDLCASTSDPIAAELLCLSLVDEDLTRDHQVTGPWEDEFVQRATELELGVRLPSDIDVTLQGERNEIVDSVVRRVLSRMGVRLGDTVWTGRT